jgi:hypothetical protein
VYRRRGERFTQQCVYESDRFGGGSVMVWAGICILTRYYMHIVNYIQGETFYRLEYSKEIFSYLKGNTICLITLEIFNLLKFKENG